jgi:1-acyl-sn-glycerol-3-phosphate acyltransferase
MCVGGIRSKKVKKDFDYSFYLGPDYQNAYRPDIHTSTIVSNHVSWFDTMNIFQYFNVAMTLDMGFKNMPLMGKMSALIDSLYLPRGSGEEKRQEAIKTIVDRQIHTENTGDCNPLLIFAEGGTTNNTALLKFKKGAFVGEKRIKPIILDYSVGTMHPAYDIIEILVLAIL